MYVCMEYMLCTLLLSHLRTYVFVHMYAYIHVCWYLCMYVCMHVCIKYVRQNMSRPTYVHKCGACKYSSIYIYVSIHECEYVLYICVYVRLNMAGSDGKLFYAI